MPRLASTATLVLPIALALGGCVTDQGTLPVAATRAVQFDLTKVDMRKTSVRRDVAGSDTRVTSVLFLPTAETPRLELAVEDALAVGGGDIMTRARVRTIDWWFLVGVSTVQVRGDVVDLSETP